MRDNVNWYVADFETTTDNFYKLNGYVKVWLYAISDAKGNIINFGKSIEEFIEYISNNLDNNIIYFHNLKFDGSFILNYLINNNFQLVDKCTQKSTKSFSTLISDLGQWFSIKVCFANNHTIEFNDSLKLLPFKVEKIANDFNLDYQKGKIDYSNYEINDTTLEYVYNDVRIVALALDQIKKQGMKKMTTASCAINEYYSLIKYYDSLFPSLDTEFLKKWRGAYRGGRCQVNNYYRSKIIKNVNRYDVNSMYPYVMYACQLPYGQPIISNKPNKDYKFELYDVDIEFKLKYGHIPSLLKSGSIGINNETYYIETEGIETILISNIDLMLVKEHYDISYLKYNKVVSFKTTDCLFKKYINKWYKIKNESKGAKRIVAKLMLNSLYGKFGSNVEGYQHRPKLIDNILCFDTSDVEELQHYYLPMAIAITSYAHALIDLAIIKSGIENFIYCDTDSVHTLGKLPIEMVDQNELGKFKLEGIETKSKYVRQKTYLYLENDKVNITCAGLPQELKDKVIKDYDNNIDKLFKDFRHGFKVKGKLLPKQVKGGCLLTETEYEIKS